MIDIGRPEDRALRALLERLHERSDAQRDEIVAHQAERASSGRSGMEKFSDADHAFFADKFVALDRDKAAFCYRFCRAIGARRIVEAGTSYGVSTLYLAAAIRDNGVEDGCVIGTEYEPAKAEAARQIFAEAGLQDYIELREGDLRETLKSLEGPIDFALIDLWDVALPALKLIAPHLRQGGVVMADNTAAHAAYYADYFTYLRDPANRFSTQTLPFNEGLEFSVRI